MKKIISIFLIMVIMFSSIVFAVTQSEINNLKNNSSDIENKIKEAESKQEEVAEQITEATKQIQQLTNKIRDYQNQIEELDGELSELESSIKKTEEELQEAEKKYIEQEEALKARIVAQYEAGETTYLDVILGGGSLWDMISNWQIASDIAEMDNRLLEEIEENKNKIAEAKKTLETSKEQVETLKKSKQNTANALKNSQAQKEQQVSELNEEDKLLQEEIDKLTAENEQIERELKQKEREYQAQLNNVSSGNYTKSSDTINLGGSGVLQRPVSGGVITATMYYSSGKYHGALDYGIPVGTTVYAAADGVVLFAGRTYGSYSGGYGGYGNYVCIQHSNGLRTYYAHGNGTFYVSEGQIVSRGQAIMLSGNTGNSTGPHLHFEVRVSPYTWSYGGGDCRVDPRNYL